MFVLIVVFQGSANMDDVPAEVADFLLYFAKVIDVSFPLFQFYQGRFKLLSFLLEVLVHDALLQR